MLVDAVRLLPETKTWRARNVRYWAGTWDQLQCLIPHFELRDFSAEPDGSPNPYLRMVVRLAQKAYERPVPVGTVSNTYSLLQHHDIGRLCLEGIRATGIETSNLNCELGLTELGEWMHLRVYFPEPYDFARRVGDHSKLRLECYNSVNGMSRVVVLFGWMRLVCTNGLVVRETIAEVSDIHNENLDPSRIVDLVTKGLGQVQSDQARMRQWDSRSVGSANLENWVDGRLADVWGKKAAFRVYHICTSGHDAEMLEPFQPGPATQKTFRRTTPIPGSPPRASTAFDVAQALSWVATARNDPEERLKWQADIPDLVEALR